jgi:hypothetical protein
MCREKKTGNEGQVTARVQGRGTAKKQEAGSRNCKEAGFRVQGSGTARELAVIPAQAGIPGRSG